MRIRIDCAEPNWDSYGAEPSTKEAIDAAVVRLEVTPTSRGGIQVSWKGEEVAVEFDKDGEIVSVYWDRS